MLVIFVRCGVLYALLLLFNQPHDVWKVLELCAVASVTLATALRREALRGALARAGTYIGIDVSGPSRHQIVSLACFESCFHFVGLFSVLLWLSLGGLVLAAILLVECLLFLYRIRIVVADDGVEVAPLASRKVFGWNGLRVEDDGTYFRLKSGTLTARFRLAPLPAVRFASDLARRGVVVHAVKAHRGNQWVSDD